MKSVKRQSRFMRKIKRAVRSVGFRRLFPVLIVGCILVAVLLVGCLRSGSRSVRKAIALELDPLKKLDSDTVSRYVPQELLFPDDSDGQVSSDQICDVFTMFFKDFDYKVRSVSIDGDKAEALLSVRTPDAGSLASDYVSSILETLIMNQADNPSTYPTDITLEERFLILNRLLSQNTYENVRNDYTINLNRVDGQWFISQDSSLRNSLVGGLITYLSDSELLSPKDTLLVYLGALEKMNIEQMGSFLGLESLLHSGDSGKNAIAQALLDKIHENYSYSIGEESVDGFKASVNASIVTIDSDSVLSSYQDTLTEYMNSPDALIDGADARQEKTQEFLLEQIQNDPPVLESETVFYLTNDGISWKLDDPGKSLSSALFGSLAQDPGLRDTPKTNEDAEDD